jgi:hypothetical protein
VKALLRFYSYTFEGAMALFLIAIALLSLGTGATLNLGFLPWTGRALSYWLLSLALVGLATLLMAMGDMLRALFFLWSLAVFVLLLRGLFLSFYQFTGPVGFKTAVLLTIGALLAAIGAWPWRPEPVRRPVKW